MKKKKAGSVFELEMGDVLELVPIRPTTGFAPKQYWEARIPTVEGEKRYEVVMIHYARGVLHRESFDDVDAAKRWLIRRWAGLLIHLDIVASYCAAAIYDQHDSRKRIFTIGAAKLLGEGTER